MKAWKSVILDTILITFGLSTLSLMSVAKGFIIEHYGITSEIYDYQHTAYVVGLFFAFLLGNTRLYQGSFKRAILTAISFAAIPQMIIPYASNWWMVVALRFIQGFVISMVPLFSTQIGRLFVAERPFAKGIILSGIFWGGLLGGIYAKTLIRLIGWKLTFIVTGLAMYAVLAIWWFLSEDFTIVEERKSVKESPFKIPFTWVLGLTFFPALWV
ncbi:MAG: MFS transporter, partial [Thermoplasmata archaeon]